MPNSVITIYNVDDHQVSAGDQGSHRSPSSSSREQFVRIFVFWIYNVQADMAPIKGRRLVKNSLPRLRRWFQPFYDWRRGGRGGEGRSLRPGRCYYTEDGKKFPLDHHTTFPSPALCFLFLFLILSNFTFICDETGKQVVQECDHSPISAASFFCFDSVPHLS